LPRFQALAPTFGYTGGLRSGETLASGLTSGAGLERLSNRIRRRHLKQVLAGEEFGLIYSNTVVNGDVLEFLADLGCPVITHVHELEQSSSGSYEEINHAREGPFRRRRGGGDSERASDHPDLKHVFIKPEHQVQEITYSSS
jgi:hypothetical protein